MLTGFLNLFKSHQELIKDVEKKINTPSVKGSKKTGVISLYKKMYKKRKK